MSAIGYPLLGDDLYGGSKTLIQRQALHSHKVKFFHPITHDEVTYKADLPADLNNLFLS